VPQRPSAPGEFRLDLWDEAETGIGCPGCFPNDDPAAPGNTEVSANGVHVITTFAEIKSGFDRKSQRIVGWVGHADLLTQYDVGRPLHSQLLLWHRDRGLQALHAGLVGRGDDGILLGGPGGSGKTTTALSCLQAGMAYLSDDYVVVDPNTGEAPVCHSVYCSAHVEPRHLERFPKLLPHAIPGRLAREDKSLLLLSDLPGAILRSSVRLRGIVFPQVVDAPVSSFRPASRAHALLRLAPSSLGLLPYPGALGDGFKALSALVDRVPVYWLDLGRDLEQIPRAVNALFDELAG
ncbi:MAG TPA: hypothetical protein VLB00_02425, partial [Gemmatimonadales bacterium]|nr:hypothetical protein [Gemmatimonadales bacterium]